MLEGLADLELLKDIQIIFPNTIKCVSLGMINIYDYLNGGTIQRGRRARWNCSRLFPGGLDKSIGELSRAKYA